MDDNGRASSCSTALFTATPPFTSFVDVPLPYDILAQSSLVIRRFVLQMPHHTQSLQITHLAEIQAADEAHIRLGLTQRFSLAKL
jgi:anti-sigma factor RsiW